MSRAIVVLAALAAAVDAVDALAQERPDFSGAWIAAAPADESVSPGSGWGDSITLLQHSNVLIVERTLYRPRDYQPPFKLRFPLDGTEGRDTVLMGRGMQVQVSTAVWQGDTLVITTVHTVPDAGRGETVTCEVRRTLSLEPAQLPAWPSSLVIETTRCGVLGGAPATTRTVYVRR